MTPNGRQNACSATPSSLSQSLGTRSGYEGNPGPATASEVCSLTEARRAGPRARKPDRCEQTLGGSSFSGCRVVDLNDCRRQDDREKHGEKKQYHRYRQFGRQCRGFFSATIIRWSRLSWATIRKAVPRGVP